MESVLRRIPGPTDQLLRVQERPGPSLRVTMVRNDPSPRETCGRPGCPLARDGPCRDRCYQENIGYSIVCRRCLDGNSSNSNTGTSSHPRIYIGESHRSIFTRFNGHLSDLKSSVKKGGGSSWMYKHIQETHDGIYNHTDIGADWKVKLCNRYIGNLWNAK